MKDVLQHQDQSQKCKAKLNPVLPNLNIAVEIYGLFPSRGPKKFLVTMFDPNTGMAEFIPIEQKDSDCLAHAIFTRWISKFRILEILTTHYDEEFHNALKHNLVTYINEHLVNLVTTEKLTMSESMYDSIKNLIQQTHLSWEDFMLALQYNYNTSYMSQLQPLLSCSATNLIEF